MEIRADEISQVLRDKISNYSAAQELTETGRVISVGDGISRVYGLANVSLGELVQFYAAGLYDGLAGH